MEYYFGKSTNSTDKTSSKYIEVNNFGYYKNIDTHLKVYRMQGRSDYQLIYISEGKGRFFINDQLQELQSGNIVIYKPHEKQIYEFNAADKSSFYWIHFSGTENQELLKGLKLMNGPYFIGDFPKITNTIENLINSYIIDEFTKESLLAGNLIVILSEISKRLHTKSSSMSLVLEAIQNDSKNTLTNRDLANMCGMSEYHFIRKFKSYTGMTPHKYKTRLIIEKAMDLLCNTELNISEISETLGFEDHLYFSRVFKKETGVSPKKFRNSNIPCFHIEKQGKI